MSPNDKKITDEAFLKQSKNLLDDSVDSLDAATLSHLNQARQKALDVNRGTPRSSFLHVTRTGSLFASFAVVAIVVFFWATTTPQQPPVLAQQYEDIEMLTADADLDLLDDLEFVGWLIEDSMDFNPEHDAELNNAS